MGAKRDDETQTAYAIRRVKEEEREACALIALGQKQISGTAWDIACEKIAEKIRGREK